MALRTFRHNPSLGGFGGESSTAIGGGVDGTTNKAVDADAFAQIIKELVDNAVDACATAVAREEQLNEKRLTPAERDKTALNNNTNNRRSWLTLLA